MSKERRRHPRKITVVKATIHDEANGHQYDANTHDLSLGGAFVECSAAELPAFGTKVAVDLGLSTGTIRIPGVVRWAKPGGMGVQFGALGAKETYALTEFLGTLPDVTS